LFITTPIRGQNGVMNTVSYAVFGLGSRAYPKYCAFAHRLDDSLSEVGAHRLFKCGEGDGLSAQEQSLQSWSVDCFKVSKTKPNLRLDT